MPRRNDIHKVMIIGSGPIVIGQACEFDYSGTQACKALRSLGYEIVLANSNPATTSGSRARNTAAARKVRGTVAAVVTSSSPISSVNAALTARRISSGSNPGMSPAVWTRDLQAPSQGGEALTGLLAFASLRRRLHLL